MMWICEEMQRIVSLDAGSSLLHSRLESERGEETEDKILLQINANQCWPTQIPGFSTGRPFNILGQKLHNQFPSSSAANMMDTPSATYIVALPKSNLRKVL